MGGLVQTDIGNGRGWLTPAAAASLARVDEEIRELLGRPLDVNEAGRTWDRQNEHYQTYLRVGYPIALDPDTPSVHQLGEAVDTDDWTNPEACAILRRNGWRQTVYRNGKLVEGWHWEYFAEHDERANEPAPDPTTTTTEEAIMNHTFYRHTDGRIFIVAGGRSVDLSAKDCRDLLKIQAKNHKRAPQIFEPAPEFTDPASFANVTQAEWNVLRAVYPPR